jgi:molybdopterin synthase sulfur carrier subunit
MEIHFYATLRAIVGQKTVQLDLPVGATVRQVVEEIVRVYPALKPELLDEQGQFYSHQKFIVNGRDMIYLEKKIETVIDAGDKIDIFPPIGGG